MKSNATKAHFSALKKKYRITHYKDESPNSSLYKILQKLEMEQDLDAEDISWLENQELYVFLGNYYRWRYLRFGDLTDKSRAFAYYNFVNDRSDAIEHFQKLKKKYHAEKHISRDPTSPFYIILLKFENDEVLTDEDVYWLTKNDLLQVLAEYFERLYSQNHNLWDLVKAGKYWRRAKKPQKTIALTNGVKAGDKKLLSAILTNRGGAYRDIGNLAVAEKCAKEALQHQPTSFYAYNLLGAIKYQKGNTDEGYKCFTKAEKLGSSRKTQDEIIKSVLEVANYDNRKRVAQHLVEKDPEKYQWAQIYLNSRAG